MVLWATKNCVTFHIWINVLMVSSLEKNPSPYCVLKTAFYLESLRLITVVSFYARICTEPTELDVGNGHLIPIRVGDVVSVPIFSYHHNPDYFPKPFEFNPDRFNNAAHVDLIKKGIFMPFGSGPRICAGEYWPRQHFDHLLYFRESNYQQYFKFPFHLCTPE